MSLLRSIRSLVSGLPRVAIFGVVILLVCSMSGPVAGQGRGFGRGDRGGRGGFGSRGTFDFLTRESAQAELKITEEQKTKIQELVDSLRPQGFGGNFNFNATEEERAAQRAQMEKEQEERRKTGTAKLKEILSGEQYPRAMQLMLHAAGTAALAWTDVAAELKITDAQKEQFKKVDEDQRAAMTAMFSQGRQGQGQGQGQQFDFEKFRKERDEKILAVLTPDQKKGWETKLGPAPVEVARPEDGNRTATQGTTPGPMPAATTPGTTPAPAPPPTPRQPLYEPAKPRDATVVADLSAGKADPTDPATAGEKLISFNFRFAPWELVLKKFSEEAELSLEMNEVPPGTFNYQDKGKYTVTEALDIVNGHLLRKGFLLLRRDRFLSVWNVDNPIPPNLIPKVKVEDLAKHGKYELMSMVLTLDGMDAVTAVEIVKELLGPQGKVVPIPKFNQIMVTDIGANLAHVNETLNGSAAVTDPTAPGFKSFALKHISAVDAERTIRDMFGLQPRGRGITTPAATTTTQQSRSSWGGQWPGFGGDWGSRSFGDRGDRGDRGRDSQQQPQQAQAVAAAAANSVKEKLQLSADTRTNTLLVAANAADMALVESMIKTIDVDQDGQGNRISRSLNTPQMATYPLQNIDLAVAVNAIDQVLPGLPITQDTKGRRLNVYATPDEQATVAGLIKQIDGEGGETVSVLWLKKMDPAAVTTTLRSLFKANDGPSIEADVQGRRLMVRGTPEQLMQIKKVLLGMGEDGERTTVADLSSGGTVRTIPLSGRDPQEIISMLERLWNESSTTPIKVVTPSALSPSIRPRTPEPPYTETPAKTPDTPVESGQRKRVVPQEQPVDLPDDLKPSASRDAEETDGEEFAQEEDPTLEELLAAAQPADDPVTGSEEQSEKSPPAAQPMPISVAVVGNNLIITSPDINALNRLEQMAQTLNQSIASRPKWTIFRLNSMDATEAATMLGQLLPSSTVAKAEDSSSIVGGLSSSLTSLGTGLMDVTGLNGLGGTGVPLRIVPDIRANSLYVTGTEEQVNQIEEFLKYLDASDLPETLKDRVPRMIPVLHADIKMVQQIVEDVYKEQLQGQNPLQQGGRGNNNAGFNPLALLMGGQQGNSRQKGIQMTVGIDERTSQLVVSANDALFKQVEAMVKAIDQSAAASEPTVQVVSIKNSSATQVQQTLASLMGKVNVSSTAQQSSRSSNTSNTQSFPQFGSPFGFGSQFGQQFGQQFGSQGSTSPFGDRSSRFSGFGRGDSNNSSDGGSRFNFGGDRSQFGGDRSQFGGFGRGRDGGR